MRKAKGPGRSPAPSYRVRSETSTRDVSKLNSRGPVWATAWSEKTHSHTTTPSRIGGRVSGMVIGSSQTRRNPSGPGATNSAAGPVMRSWACASSDGRPAQARGLPSLL